MVSCKSERQAVVSGVPQGSVLDPIFFVNDIEDGTVCNLCKFSMTQSYMYIGTVLVKSEEDAYKYRVQEDLHKLNQWFEEWQMPFNHKKSHVMHLGHNNPITEMPSPEASFA